MNDPISPSIITSVWSIVLAVILWKLTSKTSDEIKGISDKMTHLQNDINSLKTSFANNQLDVQELKGVMKIVRKGQRIMYRRLKELEEFVENWKQGQ